MAIDNIRLGGINSGFDTESMIQQMMSAYQTKIDNQNKKLTTLSWKQEAYREVTKKLTDFQDKYFDVLNRSSYIMSPSSFNKYKTDITSTGTSTNGLNVTTSSTTTPGTHKIKVNQTATSSTVKGNSITPDNFRLDVDKAFDSVNYTDVTNDDGSVTRKYEFSLNVQVGSVTKNVSFGASAEVVDGSVDMDALKQSMLDNLNLGLAANFGYSGRTGASATGVVDPDNGNEWFLQAELNADGGFEFRVGGNAGVTVTESVGSFGLTELTRSHSIALNSAVTGTNTVSIEAGGVVKAVSFEGVSSTYYDTKDEDGNEAILEEFNHLKEAAFRKAYNLSDSADIDEKQLEKFNYSELQAAKDKNAQALLDAANDAFDDEGVTFRINGSTMTASDADGGIDFAINAVDGGTLGLAKASASNKITSKTTIEDMGIAADADGKYSFKINGVDISLDKNATIDSLVNAVNKSAANVTMSYSSLTNSFVIESKEKGGAGAIEIEGNDFTKALGLTDDSGEEVGFTLGHNAILELDGQELYLNDNSYSMDGMTFTFNDDIQLGETFTVGVSKSYDEAKELIKGFVEDYNKLIDEVYDFIGTKPKTDSSDNKYEPLTDAEKEEMSEDEIKSWEETAKIGILYNDSTISGIMSKMRTSLYGAVSTEDGGKIGLYSIGIKTSDDYEDHGKLEIDEDKLDKMFEEHADEIIKLFTDAENGIMKQMDKVIEGAVKSTGSAEKRGTLIRKAGLESGASAIDNSIFKEMERVRDRIQTLQDRYNTREEYWWSVFTNMESMMSDLNSQSSYLSSYLGQY